MKTNTITIINVSGMVCRQSNIAPIIERLRLKRNNILLLLRSMQKSRSIKDRTIREPIEKN
ncbi:hypothetical protein [Olivibacter sitiensis]|uniref:hypothetical protein n=1 Tax=Olivibacter sitiensis TaxID=376470 RepID=UPI0012F96E00|nr:hypothetical protein [Olivibacter sitiensis]